MRTTTISIRYKNENMVVEVDSIYRDVTTDIRINGMISQLEQDKIFKSLFLKTRIAFILFSLDDMKAKFHGLEYNVVYGEIKQIDYDIPHNAIFIKTNRPKIDRLLVENLVSLGETDNCLKNIVNYVHKTPLLRDVLANLKEEKALTWLLEAIGKYQPRETKKEVLHSYRTCLFVIDVDYGKGHVCLSSGLFDYGTKLEMTLKDFVEILQREVNKEAEVCHFSSESFPQTYLLMLKKS